MSKEHFEKFFFVEIKQWLGTSPIFVLVSFINLERNGARSAHISSTCMQILQVWIQFYDMRLNLWMSENTSNL